MVVMTAVILTLFICRTKLQLQIIVCCEYLAYMKSGRQKSPSSDSDTSSDSDLNDKQQNAESEV